MCIMQTVRPHKYLKQVSSSKQFYNFSPKAKSPASPKPGTM